MANLAGQNFHGIGSLCLKLLLDENIDTEFVGSLPGHEVFHVSLLGWKSIANGKLLQLAQDHNFEAFITADKNMPYEQSMRGRSFPLIVLDIHPNNFKSLESCVGELLEKLNKSEPGQVYVIEGPHPKRDQ